MESEPPIQPTNVICPATGETCHYLVYLQNDIEEEQQRLKQVQESGFEQIDLEQQQRAELLGFRLVEAMAFNRPETHRQLIEILDLIPPHLQNHVFATCQNVFLPEEALASLGVEDAAAAVRGFFELSTEEQRQRGAAAAGAVAEEQGVDFEADLEFFGILLKTREGVAEQSIQGAEFHAELSDGIAQVRGEEMAFVARLCDKGPRYTRTHGLVGKKVIRCGSSAVLPSTEGATIPAE